LTYFPPQKNGDITKKAISRLLSPLMALELASGWPSSGAGYDDQENNNDAYGNSDSVGGNGTNQPVWNTVEHRRTQL
jgi:hypothetical protein